MKKRDVNVWFDKERLRPGSWKPQIKKAISRSKYFVICISEAALRKTGDETPGFQDEELNYAYDIANQQSDQDFAIIPVRLEDCDRGDSRLSGFQQYDLFDDFEGGLDRLSLHLGGRSLFEAKTEEELSEDDKIYARLMGRAGTAFYAGAIEKSFNFFETVTNLFPNVADAWYNKGISLCALGRYEEAISANNQAVKINPDLREAISRKGLRQN